MPRAKIVFTIHGKVDKAMRKKTREDQEMWEDVKRYFCPLAARANVIYYVAKRNIGVLDYHWFKDFVAGNGIKNKLLKVRKGGAEVPDHHVSMTQVGLQSGLHTKVIVSRAIEEKNWQMCAEGIQTINRNGVVVQGLFIGDGPIRQSVIDRINSQELSNVSAIGYYERPHALLHLADVMVLPSDAPEESAPVCIAEAFAKGLLVIASNRGDISEMIGHDKHAAGMVVPIGRGGKPDRAAFIAAMKTLITDKSIYAQMSRNARHRYVDLFNIMVTAHIQYGGYYRASGAGGSGRAGRA
jgi:glycosyltransferase involved in cell wall biosynthesis